jgi:hypothetical protein
VTKSNTAGRHTIIIYLTKLTIKDIFHLSTVMSVIVLDACAGKIDVMEMVFLENTSGQM